MSISLKTIVREVYKLDEADDLFEIRDAVLDRLREIKAYDDGEDTYDVPESDDELDDFLGDEEDEEEEDEPW